jgi:hypothetical protein
MKTLAPLLRAIACALTLAAALGVARAAGPHVLDLPAVAEHVATAAADAEPPLAKAYRKLGRKLRVRGAASLSRDIGLLRAAAKAAAGTLMSDAALRTLVSSRADAADAALAARPDDVESELMKVGRASDRAKVNAIRDVALDLLAQGRLVRDAEDEAPALALFAKSSAKFDAAIAMAKRIVKGQGGPLPQFKDGAR